VDAHLQILEALRVGWTIQEIERYEIVYEYGCIIGFDPEFLLEATGSRTLALPQSSRTGQVNKDSFRIGVLALIAKVRAGRMKPTAALKQFGTYVRAAADGAYRAGVRTLKDRPLNANDRLHMHGFLDVQRMHFRRWVDQAAGAQEITPRVHRMKDFTRAGMYANALDQMYLGGVLSGMGDDTWISWHTTPAEHCQDCLWFEAGSPYRKVDLPALPRDGSTRCLMNCRCFLVVHSERAGTLRSMFTARGMPLHRPGKRYVVPPASIVLPRK